jgi:hypothetical protein
MVVGRRGGKSRFVAALAVALACYRDRRGELAAGERATVMLIAADRRQARGLIRYVSGFLDGAAPLKALMVNQTRDAIDLSTGVSIEVHVASFRSTRGYTVLAAICDEIAFWPTDDSANPDTEVLNALRPAMATIPDSLLLCLSSPYAKRGELWRAYSRHFGKSDAPGLVWQADSQTMNPTLSRRVVDQAYARDTVSASAEFGGQFRSDIGSLISPDALARVVIAGRSELPPLPGGSYLGFVDPSGGSADSMTLAITHADGDVLVLDALREARPPFSPEQVVSDFAAVCKRYGLRSVTGDRYAGEWPREQFRKQGITYQTAESNRSELYLELLPLLNSRRLELLDDGRLVAQLAALERRTGSAGRDTVDHPPGGHDDVANAAAGALVLASRSPDVRRLPATFTSCARLSVGLPAGCPLLGGYAFPHDPVCGSCAGKRHVKEAYRRHLDRGGEAMGLDAFTVGRFTVNDFSSRVAEQRGINNLHL